MPSDSSDAKPRLKKGTSGKAALASGTSDDEVVSQKKPQNKPLKKDPSDDSTPERKAGNKNLKPPAQSAKGKQKKEASSDSGE